jgi:hypothetical protein
LVFAIALDPGDHVIVAAAPGMAPWQQKVTLAPYQTLPIRIPKLEAPVAARPPGAPQHSGHGATIAALVIGGLGLAAGGVGAGFLVKAYSDKSASESSPDCVGASCYVGSRGFTLRKDAHDESVLGVALAGAGGAALATAIIIGLAAPHHHDARDAWNIEPVVGPRFTGIALAGSY